MLMHSVWSTEMRSVILVDFVIFNFISLPFTRDHFTTVWLFQFQGSERKFLWFPENFLRICLKDSLYYCCTQSTFEFTDITLFINLLTLFASLNHLLRLYYHIWWIVQHNFKALWMLYPQCRWWSEPLQWWQEMLSIY